MEYGNTTDSRFMSTDGTRPIYWRINKMTDVNGNYITYTYTNTDGQPRIDEINYTGNSVSGVVPYNKIKFTYVTRTDQNTKYFAGTAMTATPVNQKYILDKITITTEGGILVKTYQCAYQNNGRYTILASITEKGSDGTNLNPISFIYGQNSNELTMVSSNSTLGILGLENVDIFTGDFDGDGDKDIFAAFHNNQTPKVYSSYKLFSSNLGIYTQIATGVLPTIDAGVNIYLGFGIGDFNGDGRSDIAIYKKVKSTPTANPDRFNSIRILYTNINSTNFTSIDYTINQTYIFENNIDAVIGDFDGDGRSDIITNHSQGDLNLHLIGKNEMNYSLAYNPQYLDNISSSGPITAIDSDGDGKNELTNNYGFVCSINKTGIVYNLEQSVVEEAYQFEQGDNSFYGDFNGDGKTDVLLEYSSVSNLFKILLGSGKSYVFNANFSLNPSTTTGIIYQSIKIGDFNNDGKDDIMHYSLDNNTKVCIDLYISNGLIFTKYNVFNAISPTQENILPVFIADLDGSGNDELISYDYYNGITVFNFSDLYQNRLLSSINNSNGKNISIEYDVLNSIQTNGTIFPLSDLIPKRYVVSKFQNSIGSSIINDRHYIYNLPKYNLTGRGFLGFEQIEELDVSRNFKTTQNFTLTGAPYFVNLLTNTTVTQGANPVSSTTYTKNITSLTNGRFKIETTNLLSQNSLTGKTEEHSYQYDAYGNTTQHIEKFNTNLEVTTVNTTYNSGGNTTPPQPAIISISKTRTRTGSPTSTFNKTISNTFDSKGQVLTSVEFSGQPKAITTTYTYNNFGDKLSKSVSTSGQTRTETYTYSTNGRFRLTENRTIGGIAQTETYTYDPKWGKPSTYKDVNNLTTTYTYDGFGRLLTLTPPSPKLATSYAYTYDAGTYSGSVFKITKTHTSKPTEITYLDALDRVRAKTVGRFSGTNVFERTYDTKGNLATTKVPNASGAGSITTTYGYNTYNQLISKNVSGIGTTNYVPSTSAGDYIIATTPPSGKFNTTTYDATGKKVKVVDAGGTVNYNYNATDDILEVLNGTNKVAECTYDIYGRQTGLKDKDINTAVTNQYEYDGWGNLILQIDAKNNKTEQTFDNWGRLITQKLTDGSNASVTTTTNTYKTSSPGLNQINTVTGFNGITETYGYDALNRPNSINKNFEGTNYLTSYIYDNDDRITKITFPSGFAANYTYNADGFLTTVKNTDNTKTLYSATGINAYNQVTNFKLGNNAVSAHTYNDYGMPTDYITSGIQNLHVEYSNLATGNMTLRKDVLKNLTENFVYDNPTDRLLSMQLGTNAVKSTTYDGTGNIISKTDAGSEYIYGDPNHIHAVTKIKSKVYNGPTLTDPQTEPCDISTEAQDITYTAFNQPNVLTEGTGTLLVKQLTYSYAANHQRIKSVYKENGTVKTSRYYFGNYEKDITNGVTNEIHYIPTGVGLGCIMVKSGGVENFYYPYKDHQGSILKVVNEAGTTTIAEQSFDAWGRPRNPANWTYTSIPTTNPAWLYRGYTGHEMLSKFALINMNGRMYDYINGRMLSPDNLVHDDKGTQGLNRYSYVFNNPLKYTDPTGEDPPYDCPDWDDAPNDDRDRDDRSYDEQLSEYWQDRFEEARTYEEVDEERYQYDFERNDYNEEYDYDYILENGGDDEVRDNRDYANPIEPKWYRPALLTGTIEVDVPKEYLNQIAVIPESADNNSNAIILKNNGKYEGDGVYFKNEEDKWYKVQGGDKIKITLSSDKTQFIISIDKGFATTRMPIGGEMMIFHEGPPIIADETGYHSGQHPKSNNPF